MKIDQTVLRETRLLALGVGLLSLLEQGVFLVCGAWWTGVLFSNLLVAAAQILNFFLLGVTLQYAVAREDQKRRELLIRLSLAGRMLLILGSVTLGALLPRVFSLWALLPPVFFNRIVFLVRGILPASGEKKKNGVAGGSADAAPMTETFADGTIPEDGTLSDGEETGADTARETENEKYEE